MSSSFHELNQKRDQMKLDWNRVLPSNELLFDRWEKAKYVGAGEGTSIYDSCMLLGDVKIGKNTWVGPYTLLDGSGGGLSIGDFCSISSGVQIYTHDTVKWSLSGGKHGKVSGATKIGDNCYIAPMCIISMGVTIGNGCVVGANSFVNKSFPDYTIIAGTPAKKIGEVHFGADGEIELDYSSKE
ncbi:acyltransferase [Paenibacillus sedimenti]|uniref:Acyltransferase n=1 Tax=Paenibacillus sedimenti TaxID=2770274 RepID=A0A926KY99_9BACL|nr:acyltransferase [Paenibacillus sedimenti]MBD0384170.1 acyltransferase [Paenibacillus sedimenti]